MKSGKYWLHPNTKRLSEIDVSVQGSNGEPCPPMDHILVQVEIINDYGIFINSGSAMKADNSNCEIKLCNRNKELK